MPFGSKSNRKHVERYGKAAQKIVRGYQVDAVLKVAQLLQREGVILRMPQGTGKSLVSQMIARLRLDGSANKKKALVIAPTIELREQYCRLGEWFERSAGSSPGRYIGQLDDSRGDAANFKEMLRDFAVIVTTPKFLANRLQHMTGFWKEIDLCVLDEVDLWSIAPIDPNDVRIHKHMETIFPALRERRIPILGLTASPLSTSTEELLAQYNCSRGWVVPAKTIGNFLPRTRIVLVPCVDPTVARLSNALTDEIKDAETQLKRAINDFETEIHSLVRRHCRWSGSRGHAAALRVQGLWGQRTRLHEDDDGAMRSVSAKQKALVAILARAGGVVVYAREVEAVEYLAALHISGRRIGFAHAARHRENIAKLQRGALDALVMTRSLGLRGLDFPDAKAMVLFSPKHDAKVMDQEMCRIRSQRHHKPLKCVYLLYYVDTYEEDKVERVVRRLANIKDDGVARYVRSTQKPVTVRPR